MGISNGEKDDGLDKSNHSDSTTTTTEKDNDTTCNTTVVSQNHQNQNQNQHQDEQNENSKMMKMNSEEIGQKDEESTEADLDVKSRAKRGLNTPATLVRVSADSGKESPANRTKSDDQITQIDSTEQADDQNQILINQILAKYLESLPNYKRPVSRNSSSSCQSSESQQVSPQVDNNKTIMSLQNTCCHCTCEIPLEESSREKNEIQLKDSDSIIIVKSQVDENINTTCTTCTCSRQLNDKKLEVLYPLSSTESNESVCRICHDNPSKFELMSPCLCKGSMGRVHRHCLERWLGESGKSTCEICGYQYITIRRPKYTGFRSFCAWMHRPTNPTDMRNFFFDLACFFILTPLAGISAWLCVVGAQHYSLGGSSTGVNMHAVPHQQNRIQGPDQVEGFQASPVEPYDIYATNPGGGKLNRRMSRNRLDSANSAWTSIGLLTLTGTLLAAYYIWLFVAIRYHIQVWRDWQMRNFLITIVPVSDENLCQCHAQQDQNTTNNNNNTGQNRLSASSDDSSDRSTTSGEESEKSTSSNGNNNNDNSTTRTRNIYEGSSDGLKINISGTLSGLKINVSKVDSNKKVFNVLQMEDSDSENQKNQNPRKKDVHEKSSKSSTCSCPSPDRDGGCAGKSKCQNRNMKISLTSLITNRNSGAKVYPEFTVLQMPAELECHKNNEEKPKNFSININGTTSAESSRETRSNHHESERLEGNLNDNNTRDGH